MFGTILHQKKKKNRNIFHQKLVYFCREWCNIILCIQLSGLPSDLLVVWFYVNCSTLLRFSFFVSNVIMRFISWGFVNIKCINACYMLSSIWLKRNDQYMLAIINCETVGCQHSRIKAIRKQIYSVM